MVDVATPKKKKGTGKPSGRPPKHPDAVDATGRSGVPMNLRVSPVIRATIPKFQSRYKRKHALSIDLTQVVEKALVEMFQRDGLLDQDGNPSEPPSDTD